MLPTARRGIFSSAELRKVTFLISFIEYAKKRSPLTAEIFYKQGVHRRNVA